LSNSYAYKNTNCHTNCHCISNFDADLYSHGYCNPYGNQNTRAYDDPDKH
jgi:hypothetical protein